MHLKKKKKKKKIFSVKQSTLHFDPCLRLIGWKKKKKKRSVTGVLLLLKFHRFILNLVVVKYLNC